MNGGRIADRGSAVAVAIRRGATAGRRRTYQHGRRGASGATIGNTSALPRSCCLSSVTEDAGNGRRRSHCQLRGTTRSWTGRGESGMMYATHERVRYYSGRSVAPRADVPPNESSQTRLDRDGDDDDGDGGTDLDAESDVSIRAMEEHLAKMKKALDQADLEEYLESPQPWQTLLRFPARAVWRSSEAPPEYIAEARRELLDRGGRTRRQLRRTFEKMIASHAALADRRESERRRHRDGGPTPNSLKAKSMIARETEAKPIIYNAEQALVSLHARFLPNYAVVKRVLQETRSLLGPSTFRPLKVLDMGIGSSAASCAALSLFGSSVEWIHGIDPSRSQRELAKLLLDAVASSALEHAEKQGDGNPSPNQIPNKARFTFGGSISDYMGASASQKGTFDLALFCYTAQEFPHTASALSVAAMLWEKLTDGGVLVVIEPGTPDGFNTVRAIREMLLDCCPPAGTAGDGDMDEEGYLYDECHVIAPCTHNGRCPMERHRPPNEIGEDTLRHAEDVLVREGDESEEIHGYSGLEEEEEDDDDDEEHDSDDDVGDDGKLHDPASWDVDDEDGETDRGRGGVISDPKHMSRVTAFDGSFCSFVQHIPGGDRKSEKFSYVVVQKRRVDSTVAQDGEDANEFRDVNLPEILAQSVRGGRRNDDLVQSVAQLEQKFLDSEADGFGLELVSGNNRGSWGRLVRAPIKKKGHILMDFCSGEENGTGDGRITRHRVGRGKLNAVAPGLYLGARKARWGGFWPDLKDRLPSSG